MGLWGWRMMHTERDEGPPDSTSAAMREAVALWYRHYYDNSVTPERDAGQRLAYTVVNKLVKTMFSEYDAELSGRGEKADGLRGALEALGAVKDSAMQQCMIGGECLLKPVPNGAGGFAVVLLRRPCYRVLSRAADGRATGYATAEVTQDGPWRYTLVETRRVDAAGWLTIENRLYRRKATGSGGVSAFYDMGARVALDTLPAYKNLRERATLPRPVYGTGLVLLKTPMENCVDGSADGVSIYAAATELMDTAYRLEAQLNREFANGASRIVASGDVLATRQDGSRALDDNLFIALDDDPANVGITVYSPALRVESYLQRKNDNLRGIENLIGLNRGVLSDVSSVQRTATEIERTEGDYNLTVQHLQAAWSRAVQGVLDLCDTLGRIYYGWDSSKAEKPVLDYGDGVLFNRDKVWQEYVGMVNSGWLKPEVALAWYFGAEDAGSESVKALLPDGYKDDNKAQTHKRQ